MKTFVRSLLFFLPIVLATASAKSPSDQKKASRILLIPYQPAMHLSDADMDIATYSEMDLGQVRTEIREGLLRALRSDLNPLYDVSVLQSDHVGDDENDLALIYRSTFFQQDTIWPISHPQQDSLLQMKRFFYAQKKKLKPEENRFMNVGFYDQQLISDLARKYNAELFVFLNEVEIKTNYDDCTTPASQVCDREIRVHYSVFDRNGKEVHGDLATSHFPSNTNDVRQIIKTSFPKIAAYIRLSLNKD